MIPLLIVDDESIIRETIAAMLRRKYPDQFHIFLASNGQEALSLVASENVELVLADIKMPVMNGLELLHRLHEQQLQCDVIFISGFDDYSFVREAMKSGAVDYLLKPIAENELYAQIDSFLKRAALRVPIHTARVRPEENVYLQQYVLDKLFDSNGIVPDGVLAELHLTPSSPAALLAAPVVSSEADLQWFQQVHEAIQPLLQTGCALFQGRKRQMCLSLCIFPDQFQFSGGADEVAVPGIKHSFAADRRAFKLSDQFLFGRFRAEVPVIASVGRNPGGIPEFCHQHECIAKPRQRFRFRIDSGRIFRHDERCGNF